MQELRIVNVSVQKCDASDERRQLFTEQSRSWQLPLSPANIISSTVTIDNHIVTAAVNPIALHVVDAAEQSSLGTFFCVQRVK